MRSIILFAAGVSVGASLAASTAVFAENMIDEIKVTAASDTALNENAMAFWPALSDDLAEAIAVIAGPGMMDSDGLDLSVQVQDVTMSGSQMFEGGSETEQNRLEAWLYVYHQDQAPPIFQKKININATTLEPSLEDYLTKIVVEPDMPAFYGALIVGWANAAVEEVRNLNIPPLARPSH